MGPSYISRLCEISPDFLARLTEAKIKHPCQAQVEFDAALSLLNDTGYITEAGSQFARDRYHTMLCRLAAEYNCQNLFEGLKHASDMATKPTRTSSMTLTALAAMGHPGMEKFLQGTNDVDLQSAPFGGSPLFAALYYGHISTASLLLDKGANWHHSMHRANRDKMETRDLGRIATTQGSTEIIDMLIERARQRLENLSKCSIHPKISLLQGALCSAALRGNMDQFRALLQHPELDQNSRLTALSHDEIICIAIHRAPPEFLTLLLELRSSFSALGTHLLLAVQGGRPEIIRLLLSKFRPPKYWLTRMLCEAIRLGHHEAAERIMKMFTPGFTPADWDSTTFKHSSFEPTKSALTDLLMNQAFEGYHNTLHSFLRSRESTSDPAEHALI